MLFSTCIIFPAHQSVRQLGNLIVQGFLYLSPAHYLSLEVWVRGCNFPLCNQVFGLSTDESESVSCSVLSNFL